MCTTITIIVWITHIIFTTYKRKEPRVKTFAKSVYLDVYSLIGCSIVPFVNKPHLITKFSESFYLYALLWSPINNEHFPNMQMTATKVIIVCKITSDKKCSLSLFGTQFLPRKITSVDWSLYFLIKSHESSSIYTECIIILQKTKSKSFLYESFTL